MPPALLPPKPVSIRESGSGWPGGKPGRNRLHQKVRLEHGPRINAMLGIQWSNFQETPRCVSAPAGSPAASVSPALDPGPLPVLSGTEAWRGGLRFSLQRQVYGKRAH